MKIYVLFSGAPFSAIYNLSFVPKEKLKLFFDRNLSTPPTALQSKGKVMKLDFSRNKMIRSQDEDKLEVFLIFGIPPLWFLPLEGLNPPVFYISRISDDPG